MPEPQKFVSQFDWTPRLVSKVKLMTTKIEAAWRLRMFSMKLKLPIITSLLALPFASLAQQSAPPPLEQMIEPPREEPTVPINPDATIRRDYESAERVSTKEAWQAFLLRHPSGYYAELARAQLSKPTSGQQITP